MDNAKPKGHRNVFIQFAVIRGDKRKQLMQSKLTLYFPFYNREFGCPGFIYGGGGGGSGGAQFGSPGEGMSAFQFAGSLPE